MKAKIGREILLLTLPVVLIGGWVWWQSQAPRGLDGLSAGIEVGAPRIEWKGFRVVQTTPAEVARGLSVRLQTTLWNGGEMPQLTNNRGFGTYISSFHQPLEVVYRRNGVWKRHIAPDGSSGVRYRVFRAEVPKNRPRPKRASWDADVYLPLADLPIDATDVQLKGQWQGIWSNPGQISAPAALAKLGKWDGKRWELQTRSPAFTVRLDTLEGLKTRAGEMPGVSREPSVRMVKVEAQSLPQAVVDGYQPTEVGDARLRITARAPVGQVSWKNNRPRVLEYRLYDESGKEWTKLSEGLQQPEWWTGSSGFSSGGTHPKGEFWLNTNLSLSHIPRAAGRVRAKVWISDSSEAWPLVVEEEVRPLWIYQRTSALQIESMRVVKTPEDKNYSDNSDYNRRPGEMRHRVEVVVRYLGTKRGVPRGFKQNHVMRPMIDFWEWEPMAPYRDGWGGGRPTPITAGDADLIFHWSQHVLTSRGTVVKTKRTGWKWTNPLGPPRLPEQLDAGGKRWKVRYDLHRLPRFKVGETLRFRAQLGVAGEGFITAELPFNASELR